MSDDWREVYESDRDFIHDAASHGVTWRGSRWRRRRMSRGRVWATCSCGKKFEVKKKRKRRQADD